jgi:peptidoglycan/LPS O-acetylase OafA/YrhL
MNRSLLLDILRISAIALVFVAHFGQLVDTSAGDFFGLKNFYYVSLGGIGVSLFLVLSGILAGLGGPSPKVGYVT